MSLANRVSRAALDVARSMRGRAREAYDAIAPPVTRAYERTMAANAEYVVKDEARAKRLGREFVYTNLARVPGAIESATAEMEAARGGEGAARRSTCGRWVRARCSRRRCTRGFASVKSWEEVGS